MGLIDRLLGRGQRPGPYGSVQDRGPAPAYGTPERTGRSRDPDEVAVERYRYLLRTAPPETIEQAHREAFAQLTPEQRRQVLEQLSREVPEEERARSDDPQSLARMATRSEMRRPGVLERSFGGYGGGMGGGIGMGGLIAGSLLTSIAGAFVGTAIADAMFDLNDDNDVGSDQAGDGDQGDGGDAGDAGDSGDSGNADAADVGYDGGDAGGYDAGGFGDFGGGDFGGDFGGGDF